MAGHGVGPAGGVEDNRGLVAAPMYRQLETVTGLVTETGRIYIVPPGAADPALFGQHHSDRLGTHHLQLTEGFGLRPQHQGGTARVAKLFRHRQQFIFDQGLEPGGATQDFLQLIPLGRQLVLLAADTDLLQFRQVAQLQFQHRFRLRIAEPETLHQRGLGFVLGADDLDHLIDIEERDQVTLEDVQALEYPLQAMLEPAPHCVGAKRQPLPQDTVQPLHAGPAVNTYHVQVDPVAALQVGAGEQVAHQALDIDAVRARYDDQSGGVLVIRLIPQVGYHGQFLCLHLLGDLLQHPRPGHLVGQGAHHDITALALPHRAHTQAAAAAGVHRHDVLAGRDNLRLGGEVRRQYMLAQFSHAGLR